ncbi:glycosyltransferase family 2 protein [Flavimarina sp. Hel_I_48]|uniref:glycosyltransferase family 2 protein n=1 Tax=Flavimarina sp. Hel_I_48 TaxID=1392488 RepID=UPI00068C04F9|nr:glycosyltransferase family 2 protein [Flavimarina sp. Hel_I_48]
MDNIVAVVVTFNRLSLLQECIKCLRNQTKIINQLIVINNGSTDGTAQWLQVQEDIYTISQENLGGAGGFHRGIKEAYENEYDWVWVMDDDAFPNEDCLEKLLLASGKIQNDHIVLAPVIVEGNKIDSLHRGYIGLTKIQYPLQTPVDDVSFNSQENPLEISFASFIGMFLSKKVIESTGFPKHEYFIFHDDVEYSIRITKSGNSIYLVKDAIIYHKTQISDAIEAYNDYQKIKIIKKTGQKNLVIGEINMLI